jgi:hypothetical protein
MSVRPSVRKELRPESLADISISGITLLTVQIGTYMYPTCILTLHVRHNSYEDRA